MGLNTILRGAVRIANKVTTVLQPEVQLQRYIGDSGDGTSEYLPPVTLKALVDWKQRVVRTPSGELALSSVTVTFLDIPALLAATPAQGFVVAGEPSPIAGQIFVKDLITLPDGRTQPIMSVGGFIDAGTGVPYATEVYLG